MKEILKILGIVRNIETNIGNVSMNYDIKKDIGMFEYI